MVLVGVEGVRGDVFSSTGAWARRANRGACEARLDASRGRRERVKMIQMGVKRVMIAGPQRWAGGVVVNVFWWTIL